MTAETPLRAIHFEEPDFLEYVSRDVPTYSQPVYSGADVLRDMETCEPIGWRIYGWSKRAPTAAPPPPVVDREELAMFIMRWRLDDDNGDWPEDKVRACLDAITSPHYGDCTKAPITCLRCEAEVAYRQADDLLALLTAYTATEKAAEKATDMIAEERAHG